MKKIILTLLLIPMLVGAVEFTVVGKGGAISVPGGQISLVCENEYCFYELDLPDGDYFYRSNDDDTCIITVNDTCPVIVSNNNLEIIQ